MGDADEPKTRAGHQATKMMAKCCVPNAVGVVRFVIKSMTVLNEARIRIKKKTLSKTKVGVCNCLIKKENNNAQLKNDHRQDSWMKSWWTTDGRTRWRPCGIIKAQLCFVTGNE